MKKLFFLGMILFFMIEEKSCAQIYDVITLEEGIFAIAGSLQTPSIKYFSTDDNLEIKHQGNIKFKEPLTKIRYKAKGNKVFVLLNYSASHSYQKVFIIIDTTTGETAFVPLLTSIFSHIGDFFIMDNKIALVGYFRNNTTIIQFMDIHDHTMELATVNFQHKILEFAEADGYLDILVSTGDNELQLVTVNEEGERLYTIDIETNLDPNFNLVSAVLQKNSDGKFRVVGTYCHKRKHSNFGYYVWEMDYTLDQRFRTYPASSLEGFEKNHDKKINRQLKHEMTKGYKLVKTMEEDGKLALVSIPNEDYRFQKRYPKVFNKSLFHILYLDERGEVSSDETFAFKRSLRSPLAHLVYRKDPPMYMVNGIIYFLYNEEFAKSPRLIVHDLRSNSTKIANEINPSIPPKASVYYSKHFKDNEVVVFGLNHDTLPQKKFFLEKVVLD